MGLFATLAVMPQPPDKSALNSPSRHRPVEAEAASHIEDVAETSPQDERVAELLEHSIDVSVLADAVQQQEAADAADTLETLQQEEAAEVLEQMDDQSAADALAEMQMPLAVGVMEDLVEDDLAYATRLLELMAPDDAADLLQAMGESYRQEALAALTLATAAQLRDLIDYDRESAGGLMTTDFLALKERMTVAQATDVIRASTIGPSVQHLLVVRDDGRLVGIIGLRDLLLAGPDHPIAELMNQTVKAVRTDLDREQVAREFDRYDFSMLPVVDLDDRLIGVVTVDDVIDIIRAEDTEDVQKSVGAGAVEAVYSGLGEKFRGRFPWLVVSLFTTCVAVIVVLQFENLIRELAILAVLMPMIAAQAGNAGHQALAVTLRGIVLEEVRPGRVVPLVLREGAVGLLTGLILGVVVGIALTLLSAVMDSVSWRLGVVAAVSMALSTGIGTLAGSSVPLLMRRLGADPATASAIFLIMITDAVAFATFLGCAQLLSGWLIGPCAVG